MNKNPLGMLARYIALILLGLGNLWFIYLIVSPLTIYTSAFIINLISKVSLTGNIISSSNFSIEIVKACIAGAAYYFLIILNLSTPMPVKKRIKSLVLSLSILFAVNTARIIIFSYFFIYGFSFADTAHKITWYFGSTLLLILIWFTSAKLVGIKSIPFYSDFKKLKNLLSQN